MAKKLKTQNSKLKTRPAPTVRVVAGPLIRGAAGGGPHPALSRARARVHWGGAGSGRRAEYDAGRTLVGRSGRGPATIGRAAVAGHVWAGPACPPRFRRRPATSWGGIAGRSPLLQSGRAARGRPAARPAAPPMAQEPSPAHRRGQGEGRPSPAAPTVAR